MDSTIDNLPFSLVFYDLVKRGTYFMGMLPAIQLSNIQDCKS